MGIPLGIYPTGNGDGEEMFPVSVRGDPVEKKFVAGTGMGAIPRWRIPRYHPQ
jgi:hypothetical protein